MPIVIVTDSTADLTHATAEQHGIEVVPLKVMFGTETYRDGLDLNGTQFYEKLQQSAHHPTTSQPSPVEFEDVYKRILASPDTEIISIHISSKLSGTLQSAQIAKTMLSEAEAARVTIIDSTYTCYGLGRFAIELAKLAKTGANSEQCVAKFEQMRAAIRLYFLVDTLEFLKRGGRIGKASAWIGSLLNIKPILTIDGEGLVAPVERVRGQKQAMKKIVEMFAAEYAQTPVQITILHAQAETAAQQLAADLHLQYQITDLQYAAIGAVIGTHVGPGSLAVMMIPQAVLVEE